MMCVLHFLFSTLSPKHEQSMQSCFPPFDAGSKRSFRAKAHGLIQALGDEGVVPRALCRSSLLTAASGERLNELMMALATHVGATVLQASRVAAPTDTPEGAAFLCGLKRDAELSPSYKDDLLWRCTALQLRILRQARAFRDRARMILAVQHQWRTAAARFVADIAEAREARRDVERQVAEFEDTAAARAALSGEAESRRAASLPLVRAEWKAVHKHAAHAHRHVEETTMADFRHHHAHGGALRVDGAGMHAAVLEAAGRRIKVREAEEDAVKTAEPGPSDRQPGEFAAFMTWGEPAAQSPRVGSPGSTPTGLAASPMASVHSRERSHSRFTGGGSTRTASRSRSPQRGRGSRAQRMRQESAEAIQDAALFGSDQAELTKLADEWLTVMDTLSNELATGAHESAEGTTRGGGAAHSRGSGSATGARAAGEEASIEAGSGNARTPPAATALGPLVSSLPTLRARVAELNHRVAGARQLSEEALEALASIRDTVARLHARLDVAEPPDIVALQQRRVQEVLPAALRGPMGDDDSMARPDSAVGAFDNRSRMGLAPATPIGGYGPRDLAAHLHSSTVNRGGGRTGRHDMMASTLRKPGHALGTAGDVAGSGMWDVATLGQQPQQKSAVHTRSRVAAGLAQSVIPEGRATGARTGTATATTGATTATTRTPPSARRSSRDLGTDGLGDAYDDSPPSEPGGAAATAGGGDRSAAPSGAAGGDDAAVARTLAFDGSQVSTRGPRTTRDAARAAASLDDSLEDALFGDSHAPGGDGRGGGDAGGRGMSASASATGSWRRVRAVDPPAPPAAGGAAPSPIQARVDTTSPPKRPQLPGAGLGELAAASSPAALRARVSQSLESLLARGMLPAQLKAPIEQRIAASADAAALRVIAQQLDEFELQQRLLAAPPPARAPAPVQR